MNGNGHTVVDDAGDSFFQVNGSVSATFADTNFEGFHGTLFDSEVRYRSVILKLGVCAEYVPVEPNVLVKQVRCGARARWRGTLINTW